MEKLGFPAFSGDGEYLEIHTLKEMEEHLGGRRDDYDNFFTARLLLLLESRPIANNARYNDAIGRVIRWYFRDFDDHPTDFKPVFLTNDIIRFWKTLCLNYENKRNVPADASKDKHRLKNLKLKFSRMLTCFSTLIAVAAEPSITPEALENLTRQTPWERLESVAKTNDLIKEYEQLVEMYEWFLTFTDRSTAEQLVSLQENLNARDAFGRAAKFGSSVSLLNHSVADEVQRYLLI